MSIMLTKKKAERNIKIHWWINLISWITFLVPIISIFYKYTWLSTFQIVLISNIFTFGMCIFELPTSVLADTMWRKRSLMASVICNFLCASLILFLPNIIWFSIAAVLQALYYSFWSWTAQAFLEENLVILWEENKFWRFFWKFSFYEQLAATITPLIASLILKLQPNIWYTILASLDVIFAFVIVILVLQLVETSKISQESKTFKQAIKINVDTWISALKNVFWNIEIRQFLVYRSLSHHATFFGIILLPILAEKWMLDWVSGIITTIFTLWSMFASKYVYKRWEKYWYNVSWVRSTIWQWICLIIAWLFFESWIFVAIIYLVFSILDGFISPSWNHCLVKVIKWKSIATSRSIVFWCVSLYATFLKWIMSYLSPNLALIILWVIILVTNTILAKNMLNSKNE